MIKIIAVFSMLFALQADSIAGELPTIFPGDTWTFLFRSMDATTVNKQGLEQFLVAADTTGDLSVKRRFGTRIDLLGNAALPWTQSSDKDWHIPTTACLIDPRGVDLGKKQQLCQTGISTDLAWPADDDISFDPGKNSTTVGNKQLVITSAGAFQAYKIDRTLFIANDKDSSKSETYHVTYWYSQQAKTMVRMLGACAAEPSRLQ